MTKVFKNTIILCCLFIAVQLGAVVNTAKDGDPIIIKVSTTQIPDGAPRSAANNPFTAYRDDTEVELFSADSTYGTVGVYLFSTAGDFVSTSFDTTSGSITIPISGLSGNYTIIITTSGGVAFEGQFII